MRVLRALTITLCALVLSAVTAPGVKADQWNKKTIATFSNPVEIPGQVLEPGTYVFKLLDSPTRSVVQIWTGDEDQLLATMNTISDYQPQPCDKSVFILDQSTGEQAAVLQSWFFAGDNAGRHFVYPEYPTNEVAANLDTAR